MLISDSNLYFALMMIMGLKINLFIVKRNSIVSEEVNDEPSRLNLQIINNKKPVYDTFSLFEYITICDDDCMKLRP